METERKRMPFYKKLLIGLLILILLNVLGACLALWLALSPQPLPVPSARDANQQAFFSALMKIQPIPIKIKRAQEGQTETIELAEAEFNSLLLAMLGEGGMAGMLSMAPGLKTSKLKGLWVRLDSGDFDFSYTRDIGFWTPFGRHLNAHARAKISISPAEGEKVEIKSATLGRLPMPSGLIQRWLDAERVAFEKRDAGATEMKRLVTELCCENGTLRLQYRPYEVRKFIEGRLGAAALNLLP